MRPRLKSLSLSGLRSFSGDNNSVSFPETGLVLLQGLNKDTGGSSGSGKSSVNLGIAYALDYSPYPSTALLSWGAVNTLKVDLTLETDAGEVRIKRTGAQSLWVAGEQVKGGAQAVKDRLKSILGVDSDVLSLLTYRGQRKPGLFLSRTDAEKKEILTQLLKLDRFEKAAEEGQARLRVLESRAQEASIKASATVQALASLPVVEFEGLTERIAALEQKLVDDKASLHFLTEALSQKEAEASQRAKSAFDAFSSSIAVAVAARDAIAKPVVDFDGAEAARLQKLVEEAGRRIKVLQDADRARRVEQDTAHKTLTDNIAAQRKVSSQKPLLLKEQERLANELTQLQANTCPTCEREWLAAAAKAQEIEAKLLALVTRIAQCDEALVKTATLQEELAALPAWEPDPVIAKLQDASSKAQGQLANENSRKKAAEQAAESEYQRQRSEYQAIVSDLKTQQQQAFAEVKGQAEAQVAAARKELQESTAAVNELTSDIRQLRFEVDSGKKIIAQRQSLEATAQKLRGEEAAAATAYNEERDLIAAIGREGFLGSIFDEVLNEISEETNQILASVANTRHCTIEFRSETTTQKGTVKKSITPVLRIGENEAQLEAGASGGMFSAIELAVDLALGEVVARREGVAPGWLILDESFSGLDSVSMESCMDILAKYARDRLVLVVDHASEFKSLFTKFITVEYVNGVSTFAT